MRFLNLLLLILFLALFAICSIASGADPQVMDIVPTSPASPPWAALLVNLIGVNPATLAIIFMALWSVSEALSLIPGVKSNGIFQLISNLLKTVGQRMGWLPTAMLCLMLIGCSTCNVSLNTTAGDSNKPTIKATDNDTPSTQVTTSATVPLK